jgi:hypothetical protein
MIRRQPAPLPVGRRLLENKASLHQFRPVQGWGVLNTAQTESHGRLVPMEDAGTELHL